VEFDIAGAVQFGLHGGYSTGMGGNTNALLGAASVRTPLTDHVRPRTDILPPGRMAVGTEWQWGIDLVVSYTVRSADVPDALFVSLSLELSPAREPATPPMPFPPAQE
jgi:hypothetical protein